MTRIDKRKNWEKKYHLKGFCKTEIELNKKQYLKDLKDLKELYPSFTEKDAERISRYQILKNPYGYKAWVEYDTSIKSSISEKVGKEDILHKLPKPKLIYMVPLETKNRPTKLKEEQKWVEVADQYFKETLLAEFKTIKDIGYFSFDKNTIHKMQWKDKQNTIKRKTAKTDRNAKRIFLEYIKKEIYNWDSIANEILEDWKKAGRLGRLLSRVAIKRLAEKEGVSIEKLDVVKASLEDADIRIVFDDTIKRSLRKQLPRGFFKVVNIGGVRKVIIEKNLLRKL